MSGESVAEIHAYPPRPAGFEEPLFRTPGSRRAVMDHFLEAPWLTLGSRLGRRSGESARCRREPVEVEFSRGRATLVRRRRGGRGRCERRRVARILSRWREVDRWWEGNGVDRIVFGVLLCGGAVVYLARERRVEGSAERPGGWFLVGVAD